MNNEQKSFPVRYMVTANKNPYDEIWCEVIDTSYGVRGADYLMCFTWSTEKAHRIAKLLNESEGYKYYDTN